MSLIIKEVDYSIFDSSHKAVVQDIGELFELYMKAKAYREEMRKSLERKKKQWEFVQLNVVLFIFKFGRVYNFKPNENHIMGGMRELSLYDSIKWEETNLAALDKAIEMMEYHEKSLLGTPD